MRVTVSLPELATQTSVSLLATSNGWSPTVISCAAPPAALTRATVLPPLSATQAESPRKTTPSGWSPTGVGVPTMCGPLVGWGALVSGGWFGDCCAADSGG